MRYRVAFIFLLLPVCRGQVNHSIAGGPARAEAQTAAQAVRCEIKFPLPNASDTGSKNFEKLLYAFLDQGCYKGWVADSEIRNTGPFIGGVSYGTHDAVKVFYS